MGPWNPEPLLLESSHDFDPSKFVLQKEGLSIAYLRMMEYLSPDERAVLLLREVFNFSYLEISNIIAKEVENCRKLFSRAKQKTLSIDDESLNYEKNKIVIERFIQAFQTQQMDALLELISEKVTLYSDGGGKIKAAICPIETRSNVLAFLYGINKKVPEGFYLEEKNVNGQPAIVIHINGKLQSIISFYISNDKIREMYITMNPDKLPTC